MLVFVCVCVFALAAKGAANQEAIDKLLELDFKLPLDSDKSCVNNPNVVGSNTIMDVLKLNFTLYHSKKRYVYPLYPDGGKSLIDSSFFDQKKPLVFMVHSELDSTPHFITEGAIAVAFNQRGEHNMISLDCGRVLVPMTTRAAMARYIGEAVAIILKELIDNGYNVNDVRLIGHEIGAHVVGFTGKAFQIITEGRLSPRITALNPSSRCFESVGRDGRLSSTDGVYVEVIHTISGYDMKKAIGGVDFYLIDGLPTVPWMEMWHNMVWRFYGEAVKNEKLFKGLECDSLESFKSGSCEGHPTAYLGYKEDETISGTYYLKLTSKAPYGLGDVGINP